MFSSNTIRFFFLLVFAASFSACAWRQAKSETTATPETVKASEVKSAIPFQTKEPETYQADFVITANGAENKTFTARSGGNRRVDFGADGNLRMSAVDKADGKGFLILRGLKIYAETSAAQTTEAPSEAADFLTGEWLDTKADAEFTSLGEENGLTRYGVTFNRGAGAETVVFINENFGLPVRQEFYTRRGDDRVLTYSVEMRNFKLLAGDDLFEIPADCKRVSTEKLRAALETEKLLDDNGKNRRNADK